MGEKGTGREEAVKLTPQRDFCPYKKSFRIINDSKHSFFDYTYWGDNYPKCELCNYLDKTRIL